MKNALILHGTNDSPQKNWLPWLREKLEEKGYRAWTPELPQSDKPNIDRYNEFLFSHVNWDFNEESILIGHSSGAVAILGLLQALPEGTTVNACYLVGAFKDNLGWDSLKELFPYPLDFEKIKTKSKKFVFIHSDNDPYCPLEHAKYLSEKVGGKLFILPGQAHFNISSGGLQYKEFPFLLDVIEN